MYAHPQHGGGAEVKNLRKAGGAWLKQCRLSRGLTQLQVADAVGLGNYTMVSMIESGRGRIPPESYGLWAAVMDMEPRDFVKEIMRYYDPITFGILFDEKNK
ncbi:transcriptional regulator with XRE-family HTH domain [Skermanella aerolata]|uniref:helix-turn-helix domain-containing protein n=1 Tax=Skermanella aerolata TaxID=393310 RepID=UPI003D20B465